MKRGVAFANIFCYVVAFGMLLLAGALVSWFVVLAFGLRIHIFNMEYAFTKHFRGEASRLERFWAHKIHTQTHTHTKCEVVRQRVISTRLVGVFGMFG